VETPFPQQPAPPPRHAPDPRAGEPGPLRLWLHALLFVLTALTTTGAGLTTWAGGAPSIREWVWGASTYAFWTLMILGSHEMGHYLACRHYRIPATLPFFLPGPPLLIGTFGAVIRIRGILPHRRALFDIAAAGPIAGFAVALPVLVVGVLRSTPVEGGLPQGGVRLGSPLVSLLLEHWFFPGVTDLYVGPLYGAGWVGMLVTSLNLFPVGQLDGGHAGYALSRRLHRLLTWTTLAALASLVVFQFTTTRSVPAYLVWFLILLWMRDRHPRLSFEHERLGPGRRALAALLLIIFVASFIPVPVSFD
jgi:membrane-associated protease RseP (regulator of RpoE activity)